MMPAIEKFQEAIRLLSEAFDEHWQDAQQEVIDRVLSAATVPPKRARAAKSSDAYADETDKKRAPKGTVPVLCDRALTAAYPKGLLPVDISDAAVDDNERMVDGSSIRGHLRRGEKEGRYEERNGRWHLGPKHEAVKDRLTDSVRGDLLSSAANIYKMGGA